MKAKWIGITLIVWITLQLICFIRTDTRDFESMIQAIPFFGGNPVTLHDWAGLAMVLIVLWGLSRLGKGRKDKSVLDPSEESDETSNLDNTESFDSDQSDEDE